MDNNGKVINTIYQYSEKDEELFEDEEVFLLIDVKDDKDPEYIKRREHFIKQTSRKKEQIADMWFYKDMVNSRVELTPDLEFDAPLKFTEKDYYRYMNDPITVPVNWYNMFDGMKANLMYFLYECADHIDEAPVNLPFMEALLCTGIFPKDIPSYVEELMSNELILAAYLNERYGCFTIILDRPKIDEAIEIMSCRSLGLPAPGDVIHFEDGTTRVHKLRD